MDSASIQFVLFGFAAALISNFSRSSTWRTIVLLAASLIFLGMLASHPIILLPLAGFLLLGYIGLVLLERGWSRSLVWSILAVIFAFVWLKKYTFLPAAIFIHRPYFTLGLSYIFFRVLHLLIEAGDSDERLAIGPIQYLLYMLNFTTFVSGPIQRYDEFAAGQFAREPVPLGPRVIGLQLERIVRGFFKVNVLGMLFNMLREDAVLQLAQPLPAALKLYAAFRLTIVYPLFLYANFSGYIDIVIAIARLMRLPLPENFDRPFASASVLEFWNRWHMTLSNWLKTYVYNPLLVALMRRLPNPELLPYLGVFCFFVTFFLIGVWHGRTSEFVVFGALTGGGMSVNKLWQLQMASHLGRKRFKNLTKSPSYVAVARGLNYVWFAFTLFWFWGDWKQLHAIFSVLKVSQWLGVWLAALLFMTALLALWEWLRGFLLSFTNSEGPIFTSRYARMVYASALVLAAFVISILLSQPAPGIVYKAF